MLNIAESLYVLEVGKGEDKNRTRTPRLWKSKYTIDTCWPCRDSKARIPAFFDKIPYVTDLSTYVNYESVESAPKPPQ
jgi:hypothetical protein